ncbi:MAG: helix-hairpin-helix domain-containing protein [Acidobacteriota bacterium]
MSDPNFSQSSEDNIRVADVLDRIADLLEFKDDNPFKVRSYRLAAGAVREMSQSVAEIAARGASALQEIEGVGKSISHQIVEIIRTGTSGYLESLKREIPETVLDLMRIRGVGIKTAQLLHRDFGISSLEDLKAFAEGGGLESVQGLGDKMIRRIREEMSKL